jgi:ABC-2 family transporter protein
MIRALILKDLSLLNYRLLWSLFLVPIALMPMVAGADRGAFGVWFVHFTCTIFIAAAALIEERSHGEMLVRLLPVSPRQIAQARYLLAGMIAAGLSALYVLPVVGISFIAPAPPPPETLLKWWLWGIAVPVAFWSIAFPLVFAFGMTRSQTALGLALAASVIVTPYLDLRPFAGLADTFGSVPSALAAVVAAVVLAYASSRVSAVICERRLA